MSAKQIVPGVYSIGLGGVNVFLVEGDDSLALVDTGLPDSADKILSAIRELGHQAQDVRHILITHLHTDHTGGLAAVKEATGATVVAHPETAAAIRAGQVWRPVQPGPGLIGKLIHRLFTSRNNPKPQAPVEVEREVADGEVVVNGIKAIHAPGHTIGHTAYLWPQQGNVLFVGDAASAMTGLGYMFIYEDLSEGQRSLARLSGLSFEVACFSHGKALVGGASARFRERFAG